MFWMIGLSSGRVDALLSCQPAEDSDICVYNPPPLHSRSDNKYVFKKRFGHLEMLIAVSRKSQHWYKKIKCNTLWQHMSLLPSCNTMNLVIVWINFVVTSMPSKLLVKKHDVFSDHEVIADFDREKLKSDIKRNHFVVHVFLINFDRVINWFAWCS